MRSNSIAGGLDQVSKMRLPDRPGAGEAVEALSFNSSRADACTHNEEDNAPSDDEWDCGPHSDLELWCSEDSFVEEQDGNLHSGKWKLNQ